MLVDDVTITVAAGKGGDGRVAFSTIPNMKGPTGGSGGDGGSIYLEAVSDLSALKRFRHEKDFKAPNGKMGGKENRDGAKAEDLKLIVPIGTVVHNLGGGGDVEMLEVGQKVQVARGGRGGLGNFHFRSSRNTTPMEFEHGKPGQAFTLRLELRLIADIGLIGLPNAGKSSLLNALTRADVRVANYPFTTLEPNLGVYGFAGAARSIILADLPGLIEGASHGKGLGIKFLRHVARTRSLLHCISVESDDPARDYNVIRQELAAHDPELIQKDECILLTKVDLISEDEVQERIRILKKLNPCVIPVSIHGKSLEELKKFLQGKI